jgi:hypothetical protein
MIETIINDGGDTIEALISFMKIIKLWTKLLESSSTTTIHIVPILHYRGKVLLEQLLNRETPIEDHPLGKYPNYTCTKLLGWNSTQKATMETAVQLFKQYFLDKMQPDDFHYIALYLTPPVKCFDKAIPILDSTGNVNQTKSEAVMKQIVSKHIPEVFKAFDLNFKMMSVLFPCDSPTFLT